MFWRWFKSTDSEVGMLNEEHPREPDPEYKPGSVCIEPKWDGTYCIEQAELDGKLVGILQEGVYVPHLSVSWSVVASNLTSIRDAIDRIKHMGMEDYLIPEQQHHLGER